jgi:uncharacterized protein YjbJ (UPF0337 family)
MNDHILAGQWKQMKGSLKSWWGKFSDDDFDRIDGAKDQLIGWVQEKYGRTQEQAAREVEDRLDEYAHTGKVRRTLTDLKERVYGAAETVLGDPEEAADAVQSRVDRARAYYQDKTFASFGADVRALVRRYPVQAVLMGIGVGIWLSRRH